MEEENLKMSLFDNPNLELNLDLDPIEELDIEENDENIDDQAGDQDSPADTSDNDTSLDEGENPDGVVEEEDDSEGDSSDEDAEETSPNLYSSLASVLVEQGLLPSLDLQDAKVESVDDLTNYFKQEITNQVKEYLVSKVGEQGYEALEKGISLSEYQNYQDDLSVLDSITEDTLKDNIELSKKVIYQDYINQGIEEKRALRLLKKTIDLGEESILEDAKESLESLKAIQSKKLEVLAAEREAQRQKEIQLQEKIDNDLKNAIYNKQEFINGIKVNKAIQDRVYNSITKVVSKSPEGIPENKLMRDRRENPIEFDSKLYYLYEITNGFKDFSKLKTTVSSSAVSQLEKSLRKNKFENSGNPSFLEDPESYGGIGNELVL